MSPTQSDNLARVRDNQRRSRARRKEYVQELEQRLRACDLQGIEASAEVQMAARRVAQENKTLRELLNSCGVSDEDIARYLESRTIGPREAGQGQSFRAGDAGAAAQTLQRLLLPRPLASLDQAASLPLPRQSSRETSVTSGSTLSSSVWEAPQPTAPLYGHQQPASATSAVFASTAFQGSTATAPVLPAAFFGQPPSLMLNDARQSMGTDQPMNYHYSMPPYEDEDPSAREYDAAGGGC